VNVGERTPGWGAIYVVDWYPVDLAQASVDRACEAFKFTAYVRIALDIFPRGRCNLREDNLTPVMRVPVEEPATRLELLWHCLRVVEPTNPNDAAYGRARLGQGARALDFGEIRQVDAHRKPCYRYKPLEHPDTSVGHNTAVRSLRHVIEQIRDVCRGLQTNQIIGGERLRELFMLWDRHECLPGWKSDVQKKADRMLKAMPAQLRSKRYQLVFVVPYHVGGAKQGQQQTTKSCVPVYEMV